MEKRITKSEFKQSVMLSMSKGDLIVVEMDNELDYDRIGSMCRLTTRRFGEDLEKNGITAIKASRSGSRTVTVSAI